MSKIKKLTVGLLVTLLCAILFASAILIFGGEWGNKWESYQGNYATVIEYSYIDVNNNLDNVCVKSGVAHTKPVKLNNDESVVFVKCLQNIVFVDGTEDDEGVFDDETNMTNTSLFITSLLIVIAIIILILLSIFVVPGIVILVVFKKRKRRRAELGRIAEEAKVKSIADVNVESEGNNLSDANADSSNS